MKKFLVLYHSPESTREKMANATPEQAKAGMEAWMNWAGKNTDLVVDLGIPLAPGKSLKLNTTTNVDSTISGYTIVQGNTMEEVTEKFKDHPHFMMAEGTIDIFEFMPMPGM